MKNNILFNLNIKQYLAVTYPLKSALILAGAGSGKTHVLINRIAWLIKFKKVLFSEILTVTFTNKAANEIIFRLSKIISNFSSIKNNIWIGTFHSICNKLLHIHYKEANLPNYFRIIDFNDQLSLINFLIKKLKLKKKKYCKKKIVYFLNNLKDKGIRYYNVNKFYSYDVNLILIYKLYEEQCELNGIVDFSELLLRTYELFLKKKKILKKYQKIFKYIFIDEFQDTNNLQYKLLKLLSNNFPKKNIIFAVGDDDQNIYSFRGANVNNMLMFKKDFNILKIIKLEQNYRSFGNILKAANILISNNKNRLGKNLYTNLSLGKKIIIFESNNDFQEAQWVTQKIKKILESNKNFYKSIAILYRSNSQSRLLEYSFFLEKIPYKLYGGYKFFEKKEIKKSIFYLKLINNIHDNYVFLEIVNFPSRGIGIKSLENLKLLAKKYNCSLFSAVFFILDKKKSSLALLNFVKLINIICIKIKNFTLKDSIIFILENVGVINYYKNFKKKNSYLDNLNQLINSVNFFLLNYFNYFINNKRYLSNFLLSDFLSYIIIDNENYKYNENKFNCLQLMTIHSAKGLEFDVVFIIGLEEGLFPYKNNLKEKNFIEEERRLMYVAITRAKKKLYISFSNSRSFFGKKIYNKKSRFIDELPNFLLKKISYKNI